MATPAATAAPGATGAATPAAAAPASGSTSGRTRSPFLSIAEQKERALERARQARAKKKLKAQMEAQRKKQEALDAELKRARDLSNLRWKECLSCLRTSVPQLKSNPWLIVLEPVFIHNYLDSLTEVLANLSRHANERDEVRAVLQEVYEAFVDLGRFAKFQPAFFIQQKETLKRFVRLLEQVAHRGSDKALFPNVLSLLGPTFEREEIYDTLAEARIVHALMSFVRTKWMPSPATLALLLAIIEQLSSSALLRELFMEDPGFPTLQAMAYGHAPGFTNEQQQQAQQALAAYPQPQPPQQEGEQAAENGEQQQTTADGNAATATAAATTDASSRAPADEAAATAVDNAEAQAV